MKGAATPKSSSTKRRGKWIMFAALAALAAFMYVAIILKSVWYGLTSP